MGTEATADSNREKNEQSIVNDGDSSDSGPTNTCSPITGEDRSTDDDVLLSNSIENEDEDCNERKQGSRIARGTESSEERIRGGGKVSREREGRRNTRRHAPYENRSSGGENKDDRNRRVYVGNLAWEVSWQDLKDHMKTIGHDVYHASIMMTAEGRSKGCGIVEFATPEGAKEAVEKLNDTELSGRQIFIREDREDRGGGRNSSNNYQGGNGVGRNGHGQQYSQQNRQGGYQGEQSQSLRVYVGNLSWDTSWQDLKDHMRQAGEAVHAEVISESNGRSKGCGIVEFATSEDARNAIETLNDTELSGRQIFVREDREDRGNSRYSSNNYMSGGGSFNGGGGQGHGYSGHNHQFSSGDQAQSLRVYVGNLSWDVAWQDLKDHMRKAGEVVHAEVICESNGRSKGCGIVEYATASEAKEAINTLSDTDLKGRMIFVREDRETANSTSRGYQGGGGGSGGGRFQNNTSVYIWNLSFETSWQDLKDHMRKAGNVDQATILTGPQGTSNGCAVVAYQRPQEAVRAIRELQNSELDGRNIYLREDRHSGGRGGKYHGGGYKNQGSGWGGAQHYDNGGGQNASSDESGCCQLFVGNLSYDTTWKELKDHFRQCGDVERAEVMSNIDGRSKGFGTIRFYNERDADSAIRRLNGKELQGRPLEVRIDNKAY